MLKCGDPSPRVIHGAVVRNDSLLYSLAESEPATLATFCREALEFHRATDRLLSSSDVFRFCSHPGNRLALRRVTGTEEASFSPMNYCVTYI